MNNTIKYISWLGTASFTAITLYNLADILKKDKTVRQTINTVRSKYLILVKNHKLYRNLKPVKK